MRVQGYKSGQLQDYNSTILQKHDRTKVSENNSTCYKRKEYMHTRVKITRAQTYISTKAQV